MENEKFKERFNEIEKFKVFILGILTGNKEDIKDLEMWYKIRSSDTIHQIKSNEIQLYNYLKSGINSFKNKDKENTEIKSKVINDNLNNEKNISENNKLDLLIEEKLKKEINILNSKFNLKLNLIQFINNFTAYETNKSFYLTDLKLYYLEGKYKISDLEIAKLLSLINELYSFKNLSIYRKISYLLLEVLIAKNKEKFHSEYTNVVINTEYKKSSLADITHFLFYVKSKASKLLHFSEEAKKIFSNIKEQSNKNLISQEINNIKSFSEFFDAKNCTYGNLINTLGSETPLLFFSHSKKFEIIDKTIIEINKQLKQLKNYKTIDFNKEFESQFNNLKNQKASIDKNDILNNIDDENLINQYLEKSKLFDEENKIFTRIKNLEQLKLEITEKLEEVLKLKNYASKYNSYFSFLDFIKMYKKETKKSEFEPYNICKFYLADELNNPVDFFKDDKENFITLIK